MRKRYKIMESLVTLCDGDDEDGGKEQDEEEEEEELEIDSEEDAEEDASLRKLVEVEEQLQKQNQVRWSVHHGLKLFQASEKPMGSIGFYYIRIYITVSKI